MITPRFSPFASLPRRSLLPGLLCGLLLAGCGEAQPPAMSSDPAVPTPAATPEPDDEIATALAKLSPEDRALAEKQKDCPVGGPLGSMDVPHKMMLGDRVIFLCCEGCEAEVKAHPEKYLAWLDERMGTSTGAAETDAETPAASPAESTGDETSAKPGNGETPAPAEAATEGT